MTTPLLFSIAFKLNKTQAELDFVDIPLDADIPLFVDPFALSVGASVFSGQCHELLVQFFEELLRAVRTNDLDRARELFLHFHEPNETHLGLSSGRPQGAGIGRQQAEQLLNAFSKSSAVATGLLTSLEECELMIDGIGSDKISDLTTNIIRVYLSDYTKEQCELLGIPTQTAALSPSFDGASLRWKSQYHQLPVWEKKPVLLVPKILVRRSHTYDAHDYYDNYVLDYLQQELINSNDSLVHSLKNGKRVIYKKELRNRFPFSKSFLYDFSKDHPDILTRYRKDKTDNKTDPEALISEDQEVKIALDLKDALKRVPAGDEKATLYHHLMMGIIELLFFPNLVHPKREQPIHDGRKRIDFVMQNAAQDGIFSQLHMTHKIPCPYVMFECKNYTKDPANPEFDQLAGRFSERRGKVGFLCFRSTSDEALLIKRCQDTYNDGRGTILPLHDGMILQLLDHLVNMRRKNIDLDIGALLQKIAFS